MSENTDALANLKATLQGQDAPAPTEPEPEPAPEVNLTDSPVPAVEDPGKKEFQHYTSSRISTCLVTTNGIRVNFTNYEYYTKVPEIIEYINEAISQGLRGITKGEMVSKDELSPMAALKRKHIAEFLESQEGRDYGDTKDKSRRTKTLTSDQVAN